MNDVLLTLQPRGQVTLPKKFRAALNLGPGAAMKASLLGEGVMVKPIGDPFTTKPKYSKAEYSKRLKKYENDGKVYWTKEDDKYLAKLRKRDDKYLNW